MCLRSAVETACCSIDQPDIADVSPIGQGGCIMKPGMFWSLESFTRYYSYRHHKKETTYFFYSKHQDVHLNEMVAMETVNYTFSRPRLCLGDEAYVTANIIHFADIVWFRIVRNTKTD
jgi:hypothetical protein